VTNKFYLFARNKPFLLCKVNITSRINSAQITYKKQLQKDNLL